MGLSAAKPTQTLVATIVIYSQWINCLRSHVSLITLVGDTENHITHSWLSGPAVQPATWDLPWKHDICTCGLHESC